MDNPFLILSVETATLGGSVCVTRGESVLASVVGDPKVSHSNRLLREVSECLETARVSLSDIDLFVVVCGPGSFTGLRIGLATVKGFAATLGRPCVGIPTLHVLARSAGPSSATIALLPAGRGEVFAQSLSVSPEGNVKEMDTPAHLAPLEVFERYGELQTLLWTGPGAQIHRDLIRDHAQKRGIEFRDPGVEVKEASEKCWTLAPEVLNFGEQVAPLALEHWKRREPMTPAHLTALYVRPSDAELKCQ